MTDLPKQAGADNWNWFGLLCELDWLVSFCVSCLLTTLLLLTCFISGAPFLWRTLLYQIALAMSRFLTEAQKLNGPARAHKNRRL